MKGIARELGVEISRFVTSFRATTDRVWTKRWENPARAALPVASWAGKWQRVAAGHVRAAGRTLAALSETCLRTIQMKAVLLRARRRLPAPSAAVGGIRRWKLFGSGKICGHYNS